MKIDIDDVTLFFDVDGESLVPDGAVMREKPTLLLLHGGPGPRPKHSQAFLLSVCGYCSGYLSGSPRYG